jgi:DNA-binding LacI/PurR family transcriptional regulator
MLYRYSMKPDRATIDTVAAACGLSRTTVSAVLRGDADRYRIAQATAARVRAAAEKLGWKANFFARSLNRKRTGTIGVLFPDVFENFMGGTVRGIEEALTAADCRMLLSTSRFDPAEELRAVEAFSYRGVDGLIVAPYSPFSGEPARGAELAAAIGDTPCVVIDRTVDGLDPAALGYGFVGQADRKAAREATAELAREGRRVAFLGFDLTASSLRERRAGYREAAAELGFEPEELLLRERNPESADVADGVRAVMAAPGAPGAWLVSTEGLAYKLAAVLRDLGLRGGADVRVGRFGIDPPWLETGLLGLRQPHRELGRTAAELLLGPADRLAASIELPVEIVREQKSTSGGSI